MNEKMKKYNMNKWEILYTVIDLNNYNMIFLENYSTVSLLLIDGIYAAKFNEICAFTYQKCNKKR